MRREPGGNSKQTILFWPNIKNYLFDLMGPLFFFFTILFTNPVHLIFCQSQFIPLISNIWDIFQDFAEVSKIKGINTCTDSFFYIKQFDLLVYYLAETTGFFTSI